MLYVHYGITFGASIGNFDEILLHLVLWQVVLQYGKK